MKLSTAQRKALAGLYLLSVGSEPTRDWKRPFNDDPWWTRLEISLRANDRWQGYPLKTLLKLRDLGLAEAEHDVAVELVESGICRCGCDRWRITDAGAEVAHGWNIVEGERKYQ